MNCLWWPCLLMDRDEMSKPSGFRTEEMKWSLVGSIYGRSSIMIAHFVPIHLQTWPPQAILVSDWPIFKNLLFWNHWACSLAELPLRQTWATLKTIMTHAFLSLTQPEVLRFPDPKGFMIINAIYILFFFVSETLDISHITVNHTDIWYGNHVGHQYMPKKNNI
jgi:hypothetical protein